MKSICISIFRLLILVASISTFAEEDTSALEERDRVSIMKVIAAKKGKIYSIYNRELEDNPGLKARMTFQIRISPSGSVEFVKVEKSTNGAEKVASMLANYIGTINFGQKKVKITTISYDLDLLPY